MGADLRSVNGFMATSAPASSLGKKVTTGLDVSEIANEDRTVRGLLLEMAAQTERLDARNQQTRIHAAVWIVAGGAAFPHRFMLEDEGTGLGSMALDADIVLSHEFRSAAFDHVAFVRVVAVGAADFAFEHG